MKIISKRQAMAIYRQHPQSRLFRFCTGKYAWSGSICHYAGREVDDISGVLADSQSAARTAMARMSYCAALR
ncbi:YeeT [Klebsiella pneumoniae]|nr:YeeT [Klebsiella pneumoniae]